MKKYILPAFCSLLLSLPSQAQKNGQAIPAPTAEYYMNHYQFDEAEELLNQDIKKLKRKRQPTDVEEGKLQEIARFRSMMRATERVTVIDSLVVDKNTFLNHIKLSPESGEISPYSTFSTVRMKTVVRSICPNWAIRYISLSRMRTNT